MITIRENSAGHWAIRGVGAALLIAFVMWVPTMDYAGIGQVNDALIIALGAMALNLVLGYTGQISIGHSAFFGIGAYATAILVKKYEWSPGWTFFAGAAVAFVIVCSPSSVIGPCACQSRPDERMSCTDSGIENTD